MDTNSEGILVLLGLYLLGVQLFPHSFADIRIILWIAGGLLCWALILRIHRPVKKASKKAATRKAPSTDDIPEDPTWQMLQKTASAMAQGSYRKPAQNGPVQYNLWGQPEPISKKPESDSKRVSQPPSIDELPPW